MRALGIDPGLATTGWAIVERRGADLHLLESGVIKTKAGTPQGERLMGIWRGLETSEIRREMPRCSAAAIENVYVGAHGQSSIKTAEAVGVIKLWLAHGTFEITEYAPASIKLAVAGHGRADKVAMRANVEYILAGKLMPKGEHEVDAAAAAIRLLREGA